MSRSVPAALVALVVLPASIRLALRRILGPFNSRRAMTSVRSATGGNLAVILSVLECARPALTLLKEAAGSGIPARTSADSVVAILVVVVVLLVVFPARTAAFIGLVGLAAGLVETCLVEGPAAGTALTIISMALLWLLGLARGLVRT